MSLKHTAGTYGKFNALFIIITAKIFLLGMDFLQVKGLIAIHFSSIAMGQIKGYRCFSYSKN